MTVQQPKASKSYGTVPNLTLYRVGPDGNPDISGDLANVHQGDAGSCYFLASLLALAVASPHSVRALLTDNGDGTYSGKFHGLESTALWAAKHPATVFTATVDGTLPGGSKPVNCGVETSGGHAIGWAAILEKLWAAVNGNSYSNIDGVGDSTAADHDIQNGLYALTGVLPTERQIKTLTVGQLRADLAAGPVVIGTDMNSSGPLTNDHSLAVLHFDETAQQVTLGDPEGPRPVVSFRKLTTTNVNQYFTVPLAVAPPPPPPPAPVPVPVPVPAPVPVPVPVPTPTPTPTPMPVPTVPPPVPAPVPPAQSLTWWQQLLRWLFPR